jgi:hypothetical protein
MATDLNAGGSKKVGVRPRRLELAVSAGHGATGASMTASAGSPSVPVLVRGVTVTFSVRPTSSGLQVV